MNAYLIYSSQQIDFGNLPRLEIQGVMPVTGADNWNLVRTPLDYSHFYQGLTGQVLGEGIPAQGQTDTFVFPIDLNAFQGLQNMGGALPSFLSQFLTQNRSQAA